MAAKAPEGGGPAGGGSEKVRTEAAVKKTEAGREVRMREAVQVLVEVVRRGCWVLMVAGEERYVSLGKV